VTADLPVRVVEVTGAHAAALSALHAACFDTSWSAAEMSKLLTMPGTRAVIATTDGDDTPLAFAMVRTAAGESEVITLGVVPAWRRRGIGRVVLDHCQDLAARDGARRMFLEVAEGNRSALALYEAADYAAVGHRPDYYRNRDGGRESARILARDLSEP
jgi:ribosomal-protein-alanine N-acetyltransferase